MEWPLYPNYIGIFSVQLDSMAPHYTLLTALGSEGFPTRGSGILGSPWRVILDPKNAFDMPRITVRLIKSGLSRSQAPDRCWWRVTKGGSDD